ncbi:hypothetical protein KQH40_01405 [bacterium]|nr:hypothetical protein [bacterium]
MGTNKFIDEILSYKNLNLAWQSMAENKSAPGVDGVSIARWGRNWEANLARLREQVMTNTYRPNKPKRFKVAKKDGSFRELSILTVSDKVLQRAVLNVIGDFFDSRFLGCSHGYRESRSVATATQQVLALRNQGFGWLLDADILDCFNSIDHKVLMSLVERVVDDWFVLNLMDLWLYAGRKIPKKAIGIPMGGVISPLWCNIYLHQLDAYLLCNGWKMVRYADDFVVLTKSREAVIAAREMTANRLAKLKLELHPQKTRIANFERGFTFLGVSFYEDGYSYQYKDKRIVVEGDEVRMLYDKPPNFYGTAWRRNNGDLIRDRDRRKDRERVQSNPCDQRG